MADKSSILDDKKRVMQIADLILGMNQDESKSRNIIVARIVKKRRMEHRGRMLFIHPFAE